MTGRGHHGVGVGEHGEWGREEGGDLGLGVNLEGFNGHKKASG